MSRVPRYISTRSAGAAVTFRDALLRGLAPDGGLYVPDSIPPLPDLQGVTSLQDVGVRVLPSWIGKSIPPEALESIVRDALNFDAPLVRLPGKWAGIDVLELFHGPTLSFKDFGARLMARLMGHFLAEREETLYILVATSGDTGSAVADGFAGRPNIRVGLLYPKGQVSAVQERQLIARRPGVRTFAVEGTFDDCQRMVKEAFLDPELGQLRLSSANSINIGRLLPQSLYYTWAVLQGGFDSVTFCVPSGNLGNLTGGVLAALGGLPVSRFIAAHNANDFFPRFLAGDDVAFTDSVRTLSNAMDVGAPSNFERLTALVQKERLNDLIQGDSVTDAETRASMRRVYDETGYTADPHTAVGLEAARRAREKSTGPIVVLSTAHPAKFPETVEEVLGSPPGVPDALTAVARAETQVERLDPSATALRAALLDHR